MVKANGWSVELNITDYKLTNLSELSEIAFERGALKIAGQIVDLASQLAPFDDNPNRPVWKSTHLEDDGMVKKEGNQILVTFGENLVEPRAALQEFGPEKYNVWFEAQPYLRPARDALVPYLSKEVAAELQRLAAQSPGVQSKGFAGIGQKVRKLFGQLKRKLFRG
jgi:hypothetical protein